MNAQQANIAMEFMKRAPLNGNEVPAWVEVMAALQNIAHPHSEASPVSPERGQVRE